MLTKSSLNLRSKAYSVSGNFSKYSNINFLLSLVGFKSLFSSNICSNEIIVNRIIVSDGNGKVILNQKTTGNSVQLETFNWQKGIYFITIKGEQIEQTQKLVIN